MATTTKTTWEQVMNLKKNDTRHKGVANTLTDDELQTIYATVDYFGGNWKQVGFDLSFARYRVFDWLAMAVGGRIEETPTKVLVHSFLKTEGDIDKFIDDLRTSDYDIDHSWEEVKLTD